MQRASAILSSVDFPESFSTLFQKGHNFRKKKLLNTKCLFWFSLQVCLKYLFLTDFFNKTWISNGVRRCSTPDWLTDTTKLTVAFRNFANAPKNLVTKLYVYLDNNFLKFPNELKLRDPFITDRAVTLLILMHIPQRTNFRYFSFYFYKYSQYLKHSLVIP